ASRFAGMVIVMLLVATLVFFITRLAPGDPAAVMLGDQATAADIAKLRTSYGLDKPLPLQFAYWLGELAHGHLGQSILLLPPAPPPGRCRRGCTSWRCRRSCSARLPPR